MISRRMEDGRMERYRVFIPKRPYIVLQLSAAAASNFTQVVQWLGKGRGAPAVQRTQSQPHW
jgi:hypothetical protein